jgi:hypothetical protein
MAQTKIDYEIQFIKEELANSTFPELNRDYLQTWLLALEWAKDNWGVYVD